jgi:hypothetical protein
VAIKLGLPSYQLATTPFALTTAKVLTGSR